MGQSCDASIGEIVRYLEERRQSRARSELEIMMNRENEFFRRALPIAPAVTKDFALRPPPEPVRDWVRTQLMRGRPQQWNEDSTQWDSDMYLSAASFKPPLLFKDVPQSYWGTDSENNHILSPDGTFAYSNRVLPRGRTLALKRSSKSGEVYFDGNVTIPVLYDAKRPLDVWMSLTPQELLSMRAGLRFAKGTVVVGGLGLGWLLSKICYKESVGSVILVESSKELMDWYGHEMCARLPKITDVIVGDAYDYVGKFRKKARYVYDLWKGYGQARGDAKWQAAKEKVPDHAWGWGDVKV